MTDRPHPDLDAPLSEAEAAEVERVNFATLPYITVPLREGRNIITGASKVRVIGFFIEARRDGHAVVDFGGLTRFPIPSGGFISDSMARFDVEFNVRRMPRRDQGPLNRPAPARLPPSRRSPPQSVKETDRWQ